MGGNEGTASLLQVLFYHGRNLQRKRDRTTEREWGNRESQSGDPAAGVAVREDGNATNPTATRPRVIAVDVEGSDEDDDEEDKRSGDWDLRGAGAGAG